VPDERANDREVQIHQAHWLQIRRLRAEGGRAYLGRSAARRGIVTGDTARISTLAEIGKRLGRKALARVAVVAKPDTILAWYRKLVAQKFDGSKHRSYPGARESVRKLRR
jgi:cytochrome P450